MSETKYEALGNGDLTPEQLDGMSMWDRDVMLDERHRAAGAYLVKRAVMEIRRRRAADAPSAERVRAVVREAVDSELTERRYKAAIGVEAWRIVDAIADRVARQLPHVAPDPSPSRQTIADAFIAGAAWVNDHAQITDSGCGASIDMPADADVDEAAVRYVAAETSALSSDDSAILEWLKALASAGVLVHQIDGISQQHTNNCRKAVALIERLQGKP